MDRTVFYISDGTGITARALGHSLLTQFSDNIQFEEVPLPYINNSEKVHEAIARIDEAYQQNGTKPLVFSTIINPEIRKGLEQSNALILDIFQTFIGPLENELGIQSSHTVGRTHGLQQNYNKYMLRINAVDFALTNDDGVTTKDYDKADCILIGVSRCGKTPTSLYLAMQFGLYVANYPITPDDLGTNHGLMPALKPYREKLFGLTILPERLQQIRQERRPNSDYASLKRCQLEVNEVESMFRSERLPFVNTTTRSVEEIAAEIVSLRGLKRRLD